MDKHEKLIKKIKGVRRIVINVCHGGFGLSEPAVMRYLELCGLSVWPDKSSRFSPLAGPTYWLVPPGDDRVGETPSNWHEMNLVERHAYNQKYSDQTFTPRDVPRDDPYLVQVVEEMGSEEASGRLAELKIIDIPADVDWVIEEYDGAEWIAERHRTWS